MIKIGIRHNLIYPLMIIIFTFFRKVDSIIMYKFINFNSSLLLTLIMFLAEFITGLFLFFYIKGFVFKRTKRIGSFELIHVSDKIKVLDNQIKIYFLVFLTAFYDFNVFLLQTFYLPQYKDVSKSLDIRARSILTISNALLCFFILKLKLLKHQKFSLVVIFICLILIIIMEFVFELFAKNCNIKTIFEVFALLILNYLFNSLLDIIEKYLIEFDFMNIFLLLLWEGLIGFILTLLYTTIENPFIEIKEVYNEQNKKIFVLLIICLIIYFITSGGRNIYRLATNKFYSPMARTLTDSFLDPLFIIYYFAFENDFINSKNKQNILYFVINLFLSIIIVFFGCVYNELFILFVCNLQHETHNQISKRASRKEESFQLFNIDIGEDEE